MTNRFVDTDHPHIKLRNDSDEPRYYFRGTIEGQFIERSLRTDNFKLARERANKVVASALGADTGSVSHRKRRRFSEAFDLVLKIQKTKSSSTFDQSRSIIENHLRPWFEKRCPFLHQLENSFESIWADYVLEEKTHLKPRKLGHDRRYLIMTLKRAHKANWIKRSFTVDDFPLNEVNESIGKYIADEEISKLLRASEKYPKFQLQIMMAVYMGMRQAEILHLQKEEIDLARREIRLDPRRLKVRRPREVPIPIANTVYPYLERAYNEAPGIFVFPAWFTNIPGQPVDPNLPQDDNSYHWEKVKRETEIQCRFHDLRHTAITNMIKAGMQDTAIRKICGVHEDTMRRIYAHIETELKEKFRGLFCAKFVQPKDDDAKLQAI